MINFVLQILPLILISTLFIFYLWKLRLNDKLEKFFWPLSIIFFFFLRSNDFYTNYLNPDELQWLVSANSATHDTRLYFSNFILADYSRFLTIFPLMAIGFLADYIDLFHARFINISLFLLFIYFQFRIIRLLFNDQSISYFVSTILIFAFAFGNNPDHISYNSEIAVITLMSVTLFIFLIAEKKEKNNIFLFFGILATLIPFAKEQALPMAIFTILFSFFRFLRKKNLSAFIFTVGGITIVLLIFLIFISSLNGWSLLDIQISNSQTYLNNGLGGSNRPFLSKSFDFIKVMFSDSTNTLLGLLMAIWLILLIVKKKIKETCENNYVIYFFLIALLTFFVSIKPGNSFFHYTILHYFYIPFFAAHLFLFINIQKKKFISIFSISVVFVFVGIFSGKKIYPVSQLFSSEKPTLDNTALLIKNYTNPNDHILIWGWENKYYLESKTLRSSYFLYPQFIQKQYPKSKECIEIYEKDILENKPKLIVEAIGLGRFYFENKKDLQIDNVSKSLNFILSKNYKLLKEGDNYRIFLRKCN